MTDSTWRPKLLYLGGVLFFLALWQIGSALIGLPIILPSPAGTVRRLGELFVSRGFLAAVGATVVRGGLGFLFSVAAALPLGVAAGLSRDLARFLEPGVAVVRATPVMSIILLALIWFRVDSVPVFVGFLMTFPVLYGNVLAGIRDIDRDLVEMARVYGVPGRRVLTEVFLPSIVPFVVAAFSNTLGLTWKVIVAAEVLSQPPYGVGSGLYEAKLMLDTGGVLAWTVVAVTLASVSEGLLRALERRWVGWKRS